MRYRTIQRRLRLSMLDHKSIPWVYKKMYGIPDEATFKGKGQKYWVETLRKAFEKFRPLKEKLL